MHSANASAAAHRDVILFPTLHIYRQRYVAMIHIILPLSRHSASHQLRRWGLKLPTRPTWSAKDDSRDESQQSLRMRTKNRIRVIFAIASSLALRETTGRSLRGRIRGRVSGEKSTAADWNPRKAERNVAGRKLSKSGRDSISAPRSKIDRAPGPINKSRECNRRSSRCFSVFMIKFAREGLAG